MRYQAMAIFVVFFGLSAIDAVTHGPWLRVAFWAAIGTLFAALEWWGYRRRATPR